MYQGFSVLAWVKDDSSLLKDLGHMTRDEIREEMLKDFCCLLSVRWHMEVTIVHIDGKRYAYGSNPRITVSERTIKNAIGTLSNHMEFVRSIASVSAEDLARYQQCKTKWSVPESVTDSSYGWDQREHQGTSQDLKRKRFS